MLLPTIIEFLIGALLILGLFNEKKVAMFEKKVFAKIRRRKFKVINGGDFNGAKKHCV